MSEAAGDDWDSAVADVRRGDGQIVAEGEGWAEHSALEGYLREGRLRAARMERRTVKTTAVAGAEGIAEGLLRR